IATAQLFDLAFRLDRYSSRPVSTDIVKRPQHSFFIARDKDRLACQFGGEKRSGLGHLVGTADNLPGIAEDSSPLQLEYLLVEIPGARNRFRQLEWLLAIKLPQLVLQTLMHGGPFHQRLTPVDIVIKDDRKREGPIGLIKPMG